MMVHKKQLIIFTRFPEAGSTKTRLIPELGTEAAAQLQREMTEHMVGQARKTGASIEIRYTGGAIEQMRNWLGDGLDYADQGEGDLGERMERAFNDHFKKGSHHIVIIGSDCPSNDWENINKAFQELNFHDLVIGPANDGGYYLIGLCGGGAGIPSPGSRASATFPNKLFQNIDWGGEQVFEQTMKAASGLSIHQLPKLDDVDLSEDIPPLISVIIPTLNEEKHLGRTLEKVREGFRVEIIVVDGGSSDGTKNIFPEILECRAGRAAQQNTGAATATGDLLLFLHADTELPEGWDWLIRETLADTSVALGAFSFKVRESFPGQKFIEDTANWRSRLGGLPYGDQGLFMRTEIFKQAGGFPDMPIMEDYAFARILRRHGKVVTLSQEAITSGRRWMQHGVFKVTMVNKLMIAGYHLGIPPERLATFYRRS
jgi:rSAM/selenodomain-associated transferase 2/rSAM/selenodomain-associated transferase 1